MGLKNGIHCNDTLPNNTLRNDGRQDIQCNNNKLNDTQHNSKPIFADYRNFAEGRNAVFGVRGFFLIAGKVD